MTERYVDREELAQIMAISPRQVDRFRAQGMPSETWGMQRFRRYLPSACIAWARKKTPIRAGK